MDLPGRLSPVALGGAAVVVGVGQFGDLGAAPDAFFGPLAELPRFGRGTALFVGALDDDLPSLFAGAQFEPVAWIDLAGRLDGRTVVLDLGVLDGGGGEAARLEEAGRQ